MVALNDLGEIGERVSMFREFLTDCGSFTDFEPSKDSISLVSGLEMYFKWS